MERKFFRTIVEVEILSEDEPVWIGEGLSLHDIDYEITEGHCSGVINLKSTEELSSLEAAQNLIRQGSDPEFFMLTEDGKDLEEEEEIDNYLK